MRIFVGHGPGSGNQRLLPLSARTGVLAEQRLENNAQRSIDRHAIAMAVDGIPYVLWRYVPRAGHMCTCSLDETTPPPLPSPLPTPNNVPPVAPAPPNSNSSVTFRQVRGKPFYRTDLDRELAEATELAEHTTYLPSYDDLDHVRPPEPAPTPENNEGEYSELSDIFGGDLQRCGICFGSRYEQAYQLQCGARVLLTTRSPYRFTGAVTVDRSARPHIFQISGGGSIIWPVTSLFGTLAVWGLAALNSLEPAENATLEYSTDAGDNWAILHNQLVPTDGREYLLRVRQTNLQQPAVLTHVEYHAQTTDLPVLQMPLYSDDTNADVFEALSTTNMELTASVAPVGKQSYLLELKYNRLWKLPDVTTKKTAAGIVYSLECNARAVQLAEQTQQLVKLYNNLYGQ